MNAAFAEKAESDIWTTTSKAREYDIPAFWNVVDISRFVFSIVQKASIPDFIVYDLNWIWHATFFPRWENAKLENNRFLSTS